MTATYFVQDHVIFRFPADAMVRLATTRTCTEDDTRRYANIILISYPSIFASLTTCAVAMKNALFRAIKISEFGKWVERHNGDHVNHVTSDDVTGARDEKRRIGNTVMSAGMSKSVNTYFIQKSFLLNTVNRHKGVIAQV